MTTSTEELGRLSIQTIAMPADTNWSGKVFGGWLVSQMDLAGAIHVERVTQGRCATISINEMTFLVPVNVGDVISCYTEILKIGNSSIKVHIEVWRVNKMDQTPLQVTEGVFTFVAITENGEKRQIAEEIKQRYP